MPAEKRKAMTNEVRISGAAEGLRARDLTAQEPTYAIIIDGPRVLKNIIKTMVKLCIFFSVPPPLAGLLDHDDDLIPLHFCHASFDIDHRCPAFPHFINPQRTGC